MKNEIILRLGISDFNDISHDELTNLIGIKPIKVLIKGEKINPNFLKVSNRNVWFLGSGKDKYSTFEDQMSDFMDIIERKMDVFTELCSKYYCEFSCAVKVYVENGESTPWIHFDSRYNNLIAKLNIEFDLDLYCWPNQQ